MYNDVAVAIAWLLGQGTERIAYVDIDAPYSDWEAGRVLGRSGVLTISVRQQPVTLFPFTGLPAETGGPGAEGSAVNVALSARSSDAAWLRAFHAVVPPLLARFWPQIRVSQHSAGTHRRDPLAHCQPAPARQRQP